MLLLRKPSNSRRLYTQSLSSINETLRQNLSRQKVADRYSRTFFPNVGMIAEEIMAPVIQMNLCSEIKTENEDRTSSFNNSAKDFLVISVQVLPALLSARRKKNITRRRER